jgi:hypothetical protein
MTAGIVTLHIIEIVPDFLLKIYIYCVICLMGYLGTYGLAVSDAFFGTIYGQC